MGNLLFLFGFNDAYGRKVVEVTEVLDADRTIQFILAFQSEGFFLGSLFVYQVLHGIADHEEDQEENGYNSPDHPYALPDISKHKFHPAQDQDSGGIMEIMGN